ncbi:NAD(P)H-dependent oxidoreductase [Timonella sp. A28]|uniref:NAD(P)H-dependent oxidoreductase n=1 Tax=Timonella sp. A28 TaxID=3442640 RepID=UPI003EBBB175
MSKTPRVLVIIGHPISDSLNHSIARTYIDSFADTAQVDVIDLAQETPAVQPQRAQLSARSGREHLRTDQQKNMALIENADHIVWVFPQWWGLYPGVMKSFIDETFLSGFGFDYSDKFPKGLLSGKTGRIISTMDAPPLWNALWYRNAVGASLKRALMRYVGIRPVGATYFSPVRTSTPQKREKWLAMVAQLARKDAKRLGLEAAHNTDTQVEKAPAGV